jgi:hypothetical protein
VPAGRGIARAAIASLLILIGGLGVLALDVSGNPRLRISSPARVIAVAMNTARPTSSNFCLWFGFGMGDQVGRRIN